MTMHRSCALPLTLALAACSSSPSVHYHTPSGCEAASLVPLPEDIPEPDFDLGAFTGGVLEPSPRVPGMAPIDVALYDLEWASDWLLHLPSPEPDCGGESWLTRSIDLTAVVGGVAYDMSRNGTSNGGWARWPLDGSPHFVAAGTALEDDDPLADLFRDEFLARWEVDEVRNLSFGFRFSEVPLWWRVSGFWSGPEMGGNSSFMGTTRATSVVTP